MTEKKKRPAWEIFVTIPAVLVGAWAGMTLSQYVYTHWRAASAESQLVQTSVDLNKSLPKMVDAETRLDSTSVGPAHTLHYHYTLIHIQPGQVSEGKLREVIRPKIVDSYRHSDEMQAFRDEGVTMIYEYDTASGVRIGDITVGPDDLKEP